MKGHFVQFLQALGLGWEYLLNGLIGGLVYSIYKKSRFWDALRQVFIGGIVAGYSTPIIIDRLGVKYVGFISFTIGLVGMVVVDSLIQWIIKKIKLIF